LGATIISISEILRGFATSFEAMFVAAAIFGVGGPLVSIGLTKLIVSWFSGKERETTSSACLAGSNSGMTFSFFTRAPRTRITEHARVWGLKLLSAIFREPRKFPDLGACV